MEATYRRPRWLSESYRPRSADGGPKVICQTWNDYGRSDATVRARPRRLRALRIPSLFPM